MTKITFTVRDKRTGKDITADYLWLIGADGTLYYNNYDLIRADSFAEVIFTMKEI